MKSKFLFLSLISIYIVFVVINTLLDLNIDSSDSKRFRTQESIKNISDYQKDINISYISINEIWGLKKFKPKELNSTKDLNNTIPKNIDIQLRDTNGFYTIIIDKKEFDFLGVVKRGDELFTLLYDNSKKRSRDAIKEYKKGDTLSNSIQLHKISSNSIKLIDTTTHKKVIVPYFLVKEDEFKPEGNVSEY